MGKKDRFTKEKRSEIMAKIKSKNTDIEVIFKKFLRKKGIRYLNKKLPGSPDVVLRDLKIAIFCDGDFWHGRKYKVIRPGLNDYWRKKIENNMKRDRRVDGFLKEKGWKGLRFWGQDILKEPEKCLAKVRKEMARFR